MTDDLGRRLEDLADRLPEGHPDAASVIQRGRRMKARRATASGVSAVTAIAVGWAALAMPWSVRPEPEIVGPGSDDGRSNALIYEEVSEQTRAEIFAFRALARNGLIDPFGARSYNWTYEDDTTETEGGWRVGFAASDCEPKGGTFTCTGLSGEDPELGNAITDTYVTVALQDEEWQVLYVEGNMPPEDVKRLEGFTLPDEREPSHWDFAAASVWRGSPEPAFSMMPIWVGPYPTDAPGSVCTIQGADDSGAPVGKETVEYFEPPNREFERGGWVRSGGVKLPPEAVDVEVSCEQKAGEGLANGPLRIEASDAPISTGGYVFSDLFFKTDRNFDANGKETISLSGHIDFEDDFPGTKKCTWMVLDPDGNVIGSATNTFTAHGPSEGMLMDTLVINGQPDRIAIECSGRSEGQSGSDGFVTLVIDKRDGCLAETSTPRRYRMEATFKKDEQPTRSCP